MLPPAIMKTLTFPAPDAVIQSTTISLGMCGRLPTFAVYRRQMLTNSARFSDLVCRSWLSRDSIGGGRGGAEEDRKAPKGPPKHGRQPVTIQVEIDKTAPSPSGLVLGCVVRFGKGGPVRFVQVSLPWSTISEDSRRAAVAAFNQRLDTTPEDQPLF